MRSRRGDGAEVNQWEDACLPETTALGSSRFGMVLGLADEGRR